MQVCASNNDNLEPVLEAVMKGRIPFEVLHIYVAIIPEEQFGNPLVLTLRTMC